MSSTSGPFLPQEETTEDGPDDKVPWSFRIILGLAVLYLGWRLVEGVIWVVERITG